MKFSRVAAAFVQAATAAGTAALRVGALPRRLAAALLLSLVLHAFVMLGIKPVSANYAESERPRARLNVSLSRELPETAKPVAQRDPKSKEDTLRPGSEAGEREGWLELPTFAADEYFSAHEVDQRATPVGEVPLVYPPAQSASETSGKVVLLLFINEAGHVDRAEVLEAVPSGDFEASARAAFAATKFKPALKNGNPVKSRKIVEITYDHS